MARIMFATTTTPNFLELSEGKEREERMKGGAQEDKSWAENGRGDRGEALLWAWRPWGWSRLHKQEPNSYGSRIKYQLTLTRKILSSRTSNHKTEP